FAGTSEFAVPALTALARSDHELVAVITQPARPAGRGRRLRVTPVQEAAGRLGLSVETPGDLGDPQWRKQFEALAPDALVVVSYGELVPGWMLELPAHGALNIHPSLLPRWRGAAPVERAML